MGRTDKSLKEITEALTTYSERIQVLEKQRTSPVMRNSYLQSINLQLRNTKRKFYELRKELEAKIKGEIILVSYELDGQTLSGRFVNLSDSEIEFLYRNLSIWSGKEIRILNIERLPTYLSDK